MRKARLSVHLSSRAAIGALGAFASIAAIFAPGPTQNAAANGDTRTISLYHSHTRESIQATYMVDGRYDSAVLDKLNWFLRDWRLDEPTKMDPRLFDVIWESYRSSGSREPIQVVSAYRSPKTNAMLRRRSKAVAEHSQHMLGKAMDMHYSDVPMSRIREIAMKMQRGGVGYYPSAGTPFVHLDVGSVRAWPRMTYDQLARLFPDGKTVHLPTNGHPMARYEEARAEIMARSGQSMPTVAQVKTKGLFASLFGLGSDDEEQAAAPAPTGPRSRMAALVSRNGRRQAPPAEAEAPRSTPVVQRAESDLPRGATYLQPGGSGATRAAPPPDARLVAALTAPIPPRRPNELLGSLLTATDAPLPPNRPADLFRQQVADTRTAIARAGDLPSVITAGTSRPTTAQASALPVPASLLAYAPQADAAPVANPAALHDVPLPPVRAVALRPTLAPPPAQAIGIRAASQMLKPRLMAARLDRSNFRILTSPAQIAKVAPGGIGPAAAPVRAAARVDLVSVAFTTDATLVSRFAAKATPLDERRFTGPAVQALPRYEAAAVRPGIAREAFN